MLFDDTYRTIEKPAEGIFRDRGSKFQAYAYPLNSDTELKDILTALKSEHPKANHHCWALRLGIDRSMFRVNDDGEPSGTAGRPILNTLLSKDLTNLAVVVVRYFGGTLLGVPGLINAYKTATAEAFANTPKTQKWIEEMFDISFDYPVMGEVLYLLKQSGATIYKQDLQLFCSVQAGIPRKQSAQYVQKLSE